MSGRTPVLLTIAGSDSGGGAGVQADLRAFWDHDWFGTNVLTAVTAQDTARVWRIDAVPAAGIAEQLRVVLADFDVTAIKIGMLGGREAILTVADGLRESGFDRPIVLDPVMVATSGDRLLPEDAVHALREALVPLATLVTPNLHEAPLLGAATDAAGLARELGVSCLVTGGDAEGAVVIDTLAMPNGEARTWSLSRLDAGSHGTGCTLSSAIAAQLASGRTLEEACEAGIHYVRARLERALTVGQGSTVLGRMRP